MNLPDPTALLQQATALEGQLRAALSQAEYWKKEAEKRLGEVAAGIRDPASLIEWIEVTSQVSPLVRVDEPLRSRPSDPNAGPGPLERIRPQLRVKFRGLDKPTTIAPWGTPTENYYNSALGAGGVVLALAVYGAWKLVE